MDPSAAERIGRTDSAFRDANEQIVVRAEEELSDGEQAVPFICECADEDCATIVQLTLSEYEDVRTDSRQFLNVIGHERSEGLVEIVSTNHNHLVVRKSGLAGEIADELDLRHRRNGGG
jgi:hypothetical protein